MQTWTLADPESGNTRLTHVGPADETVASEPGAFDCYSAAVLLAANYHLKPGLVLDALRGAYPASGEVPTHHLEALAEQIESQCADYEEDWEQLDVALALVKPEGFTLEVIDGQPVYTTRISFAKDRSHLYRIPENLPDSQRARDYSFHYEGYNFDSAPESEYLERALNLIGEHAENIEGVWFTGGLTDPAKTDLFADYLGEDGRWHRYTPDFVVQRKDGKHLVVEIKNDRFSAEVRSGLERRNDGTAPQSPEGRKAVALKKWEDLNPDVLHYQVIFANETLTTNALDRTRQFLDQKNTN